MPASLNTAPSSERVHIAFFGRRNAGKSSVVNAVTGQELSIVSDHKGTTTDPVTKAMELLPVGPVLIIDTPGIDDEGEVGELRIRRAREVMNKTDVAVLVVDASVGFSEDDRALEKSLEKKKIPFVTVMNKADLKEGLVSSDGVVAVSAKTRQGINELKENIAALASGKENPRKIIGDRLSVGDHVVLVTPIDSSAPKGRMILPQVMTIRDILDAGAFCTVVQTDDLPKALDSLKSPPKLVVTDSQAFGRVKDIVPDSVPLTSFSILMAEYKGILSASVQGASMLKKLKSGDRVLICEGCTHHRQCEDIGTVKLPGWIRQYTGAEPCFDFTSGGEFPEESALAGYRLIIHCGGCMLSEREMGWRLKCAEGTIPFTNYGTAIAMMNGILERSLRFFPEYNDILKQQS